MIPSIRAAQLSGYSQDYVGQLCRSGSIECKRVLGEWRVNLESLLAYKKRFNPNFKPHGVSDKTIIDDSLVSVSVGHKDVFTKGGIEYISSADAAALTGYSQDYVGQLARSDIVPAQKVGRKWFVSKVDLLKHKKHNDALLVAVQENSLGINKKAILKEGKGDASSSVRKIKINKLPEIIYKREDGQIIPSGSMTDKNSDEQTQTENSFDSTIKVMDLRQNKHSFSTKNITALAVNKKPTNHNPVTKDKPSRCNSRSLLLNSYVLLFIIGIEIVVLTMFILLPDLIYIAVNLLADRVDLFNMSLTHLKESTFTQYLLERFSTYSL